MRKAPDPGVKMPPKKEEKSKEEIMAEREAKKAEKAAKKAAAKVWNYGRMRCLVESLFLAILIDTSDWTDGFLLWQQI